LHSAVSRISQISAAIWRRCEIDRAEYRPCLHLTDDEARKYIQQARRKVMAADGMRLWEVSKNGR
jgi:hypothetical protein